MGESGSYLTSFLEITVDTDKELSNLALLDAQEQGTYFHEYVHYLQDVTTSSGLSKIWNAFDRFRQLIASIQPAEITEVHVPLETKIAKEQQEYIRSFNAIRGAGRIDGASQEVADTYSIEDVQCEADPKIAAYFGDFQASRISIYLHSEGRQGKIFNFGEAAVSETMAYLIEKKFYPTLNKLARYPYQVAYDLVEHIHSDLLKIDENLFALCDVALMHNMPGWAFYEIINEMKDQNVTPQSGEALIDFSYQFYRKIGWDFTAYMATSADALQHITDMLFPNGHFKATKMLLQASIERGRLLRENFPYAVLNIYKGEAALNFNFYKVFNFLGGPHAVNRNGNRVVRVPEGLDHLIDQAYPQYFRIVWQFDKFLLTGLKPCSVFKICDVAQNNQIAPVDDRCINSPWKRAEDGFKCPYAIFWEMFGFQQKDFYLDGIPIQIQGQFEA